MLFFYIEPFDCDSQAVFIFNIFVNFINKSLTQNTKIVLYICIMFNK